MLHATPTHRPTNTDPSNYQMSKMFTCRNDPWVLVQNVHTCMEWTCTCELSAIFQLHSVNAFAAVHLFMLPRLPIGGHVAAATVAILAAPGRPPTGPETILRQPVSVGDSCNWPRVQHFVLIFFRAQHWIIYVECRTISIVALLTCVNVVAVVVTCDLPMPRRSPCAVSIPWQLSVINAWLRTKLLWQIIFYKPCPNVAYFSLSFLSFCTLLNYNFVILSRIRHVVPALIKCS